MASFLRPFATRIISNLQSEKWKLNCPVSWKFWVQWQLGDITKLDLGLFGWHAAKPVCWQQVWIVTGLRIRMGIKFWIETLIMNSVLGGLGFRETTLGEKPNRDLKNRLKPWSTDWKLHCHLIPWGFSTKQTSRFFLHLANASEIFLLLVFPK